MHMPVNTAVRAVVRSPGKAAPLGVSVVLAGRCIHLKKKNVCYLACCPTESSMKGVFMDQ